MKNTFSLKKAFSFGFKAAWNNLGSLVATWLIMAAAGLPTLVGLIAFARYHGIEMAQLSAYLSVRGMTPFNAVSYLGWFSAGMFLSTLLWALITPGLYKMALDVYAIGQCSYKSLFTQVRTAGSIWLLYTLPPYIALAVSQELMGISAMSFEYRILSVFYATVWFWVYGAVPFLLVDNKIGISDVLLNRQWKKTLMTIIDYKWILLGFISACVYSFAPVLYFVALFAQAYAYRQLFTEDVTV